MSKTPIPKVQPKIPLSKVTPSKKLSRRDLLKNMSMIGAASALPSLLSSCAGINDNHPFPAPADFCPAPSPLTSPLPNIVIILTDDQGFADVGVNDAVGFSTPNLDKMAADGCCFNAFYVAAPVCTPSRAALLTGCYPRRNSMEDGVLFPNSIHGLHPHEVTIADSLKCLGYATACIGKWHVGHQAGLLPTHQGFDYFYGPPYSNDMTPFYILENETIIDANPNQDLLTQNITARALQFITENSNNPFFLYVPHPMPHVPLHVSDAFRGTSARGLYGDVIQEIDWSVGEIIRKLDELNIIQDTLIIFTSDNGPWLNQGENGGSAIPLRGGKGSVYEGGMRAPCIMQWPNGIPAASVCNELTSTLDILPTVASITGSPLPTAPDTKLIDGNDIAQLLSNPSLSKSPTDYYLYYSNAGELKAVRDSRGWKLHMAEQELYYLGIDIGEVNNMYNLRSDVVSRLQTNATAIASDINAQRRPNRTVWQGLFS